MELDTVGAHIWGNGHEQFKGYAETLKMISGIGVMTGVYRTAPWSNPTPADDGSIKLTAVSGAAHFFTPDGEFLDMWPGFERPTKLYVGSDNVMFVAELEDRVSMVDLDGNVIGRFGSERSHDPGRFWGPHGIWTDSVGDLYVAEVLEGARLQKFARRR